MRVLAWPAGGHRELNPYTYLLYKPLEGSGIEIEEFSTTKLLKRRYDIWHMHWPEHFLNRRGEFQALVKARALPTMMDAAHALGTKIVWTTHNLCAHERRRPELEEEFWRRFTKRLDAFISLSNSALLLARERHPALRNLPGFVIPHGHYRDEYPVTYSRDTARQTLGLEEHATVILNFGTVRPYKGVLELIRAFKNLPEPSATLLIAGRGGDPALLGAIKDEAGHDRRIRLCVFDIPSSEVQMYFAASDAVVLPYTATLNSGSAMLALSLNRPVYVPALGSIPELQRHVGDEWVRMYSGDFGTSALENAIAWSRLSRPASPPLDKFDWDNLSRSLIAAYQDVLRSKNQKQLSCAHQGQPLSEKEVPRCG